MNPNEIGKLLSESLMPGETGLEPDQGNTDPLLQSIIAGDIEGVRSAIKLGYGAGYDQEYMEAALAGGNKEIINLIKWAGVENYGEIDPDDDSGVYYGVDDVDDEIDPDDYEVGSDGNPLSESLETEPFGAIITKYASEYLRSIGGYSADVSDEWAAFVKWLMSNKDFKKDLIRIINKNWIDYIANFGADLAYGASLDKASAAGGASAVGGVRGQDEDDDPADWWKRSPE